MRKKIFLKGPLLTRSGYGEQARFALRALRSREDLFEIFIQPIEWGKTSWTPEMDKERAWIDQTIEKTIAYIQQGGQFDLSLQVTIPNEFQRIAPVNVGYTAGIETTKIAHQWIQKINEMDKIITVSSHSKNVIENTEYGAKNSQTGEQFILKAQTPVEFVNYPVKTYDSLPELELNLTTSFNFLSVAQFGPRKNLLNTIKWFIEEFRNEDVGLVIKSNLSKNCLIDRNRLRNELANFLRQQGERQCKVYLLHGDLTDAEMHSLYRNPQINAFVSLPHGEGFGLPIFEAAYSGLPVVATGWSGQLDFLIDAEGREQFYNVSFDLQAVQPEVVWDGVLVKDSMWAFPREGSAKEQMRACFNDLNGDNDSNHTTLIGLEQAAQQLHERFSEQAMYEQFVGEIIGKSKLQPEPVTGISFCISTNGAKPEKTELEIKSIHKTMEPVDIPYEIIVAGNTTPFTEMGITAVHTPEDADNGLLAKLRNNAAEVASQDVLVFVDDDFIFPETWASRFLEYSNTEGWQVTANKIFLPDGGRFWDRATMNPHKLVSYDHPSYDTSLYQTGGFWIMRREVYESYKWNSAIPINAEKNGTPNEDIEMSLRMHNNGVILTFDKENTVWHNDDSYMEFNEQTLKRSVLADKFGDFMLDSGEPVDEFAQTMEKIA